MADWVKCTPLGQPGQSICFNVDRIIAVSGGSNGSNGSNVIFGVGNGTDAAQMAVVQTPESILGGNGIRQA